MKLPKARETSGYHHARLKDVQEQFMYDLTGEELVVTTVRNHWDAIASWWLLNGRAMSLYNFIYEYKHSFFAKRNKLWWLHTDANYVVHYEELTEGFKIITQMLDLPDINLTVENATPNKQNWQIYYSQEAFWRVFERFKEEIKLYGYDVWTLGN